jgi:hypothetical protein
MAENNFQGTLRSLAEADVDFIVVGGLAAVLNGAPVNTFDVDIVPSRDEANIKKLLRVLAAIDAIYRMQPERRLSPDAGHLKSSGHHNLITAFGPLDVLGTIGHALAYEELLPHTIEMSVGQGLRVRILDLPTIIALKEELGGEKDRAVLPVLRRTLEAKRANESQGCQGTLNR